MLHQLIRRLYFITAGAALCVGAGARPAAAQSEVIRYDPEISEGPELRPTTCPTWTTEGFFGTPVYEFGGYLFITAWALEAKFEGKTEGYYHAAPDPDPKDIFKRVRWQGARLYVTCRQWVWRDAWGIERFGFTVYDSIEGKEEGTIRPCSRGLELAPLNPYDPYDPNGSTEDCGDDTPLYPEPGTGGGGEPGGGGGSSCHTEYIVIEISLDDGATWSTYWEGYATVCE